MTPNAREFRTRAIPCAELASGIPSRALKETLTTMSRNWEELALAIEKYEGRPMKRRTEAQGVPSADLLTRDILAFRKF